MFTYEIQDISRGPCGGARGGQGWTDGMRAAGIPGGCVVSGPESIGWGLGVVFLILREKGLQKTFDKCS